MRLVYRILCLAISFAPNLDHVEYFAGLARLSAAYRATGHAAREFEYNNDQAVRVQSLCLRVHAGFWVLPRKRFSGIEASLAFSAFGSGQRSYTYAVRSARTS